MSGSRRFAGSAAHAHAVNEYRGMSDRGPTRIVVFFRQEGGWYPLELPLSDDLSAHAEANPGTLKITAEDGETILWRRQ